MTAAIERKVRAMVDRAAGQLPPAKQQQAPAAAAARLPLIRLRVDYTGFSTINTQRFGQTYVGRVANPHDMLLFTKAASRKAKVLAFL